MHLYLTLTLLCTLPCNRARGVQATDGTLKTQVDLGNNFFCQAKVPDTSLVCVAIGFGFFVEMTLDEAAAFIKKKTQQLGITGEPCAIERPERLVFF